jgi:hypothetical protein
MCLFAANFYLYFKRSFEENAHVAANKNQKIRKIFSPSITPYSSITYKGSFGLLCLLWRAFFVEIAQVAPISRGHLFVLSVSPEVYLAFGGPASGSWLLPYSLTTKHRKPNQPNLPISPQAHLSCPVRCVAISLGPTLPISPAEKIIVPICEAKIRNSLWQNNLRKNTPINSINLAYNSAPIREYKRLFKAISSVIQDNWR